MAKVTSHIFADIHGTIAGAQYETTRTSAITLRSAHRQPPPYRSTQRYTSQAFTDAVRKWGALSQNDRSLWLTRHSPATGRSAFLSAYTIPWLLVNRFHQTLPFNKFHPYPLERRPWLTVRWYPIGSPWTQLRLIVNNASLDNCYLFWSVQNGSGVGSMRRCSGLVNLLTEFNAIGAGGVLSRLYSGFLPSRTYRLSVYACWLANGLACERVIDLPAFNGAS